LSHANHLLTESQDVCVIGAGWVGLYAVKYMKEYGLSVVAFDKNPTVGGLWKWSADKTTPTVASFTITSTPKAFTEAADFPWPEEEGMYIKHDKVYKWLEDYTDHFDLR
jgi:dimethylaniline monooxygenase (N-oxide forming)